MIVDRSKWHYKIAHFASTRLERDIHTRGGYLERVALGILSLCTLIVLVSTTILAPTLFFMFEHNYIAFPEVPLIVLFLGAIGVVFDGLILGGTSIFFLVIILSALNVHIFSPIKKWLNARQGNGIMAQYLTSLSDEVSYKEEHDDRVD